MTSPFTAEVVQQILERLSLGESLRSICETDGFPTETAVRKKAIADADFGSQYARARDIGLDTKADDIMIRTQSVGAEDVPSRRLEFDAARWYLSKLAPKRYGDAVSLKHGDPDGNVLRVEVTRVAGKK